MARRIQRAVVVLPQPLSPTSPKVSPSCNVKLTPSTARTYPTVRRQKPLRIGKNFCSSLTSSNGRLLAVPASLTSSAPARTSPHPSSGLPSHFIPYSYFETAPKLGRGHRVQSRVHPH